MSKTCLTDLPYCFVFNTGDLNGLSYHNGRHFSTFDMDRDRTGWNCAIQDHGGWWYRGCAYANLNGEYITPGTKRPLRNEGGMIYRPFKGRESLKVSKIMFRRV
jgi:ficolin